MKFEEIRSSRERLAAEIMEKMPNMQKRRASSIATVLHRNGVESVSDIASIDIADAIKWNNCGEKMCSELKELGAYGELPEKQPPKNMLILTCAMCGNEMKVGERVTLNMSWEGAKPGKVTYSNSKARAVKVCRECAHEICAEHGLELEVDFES